MNQIYYHHNHKIILIIRFKILLILSKISLKNKFKFIIFLAKLDIFIIEKKIILKKNK